MNQTPITTFAFLTSMLFLVVACNTTSSMNIPNVSTTSGTEVTVPATKQASFALSKIIAGLKRGEPIAHFPGAGVKGVDGTLCNKDYGDDAIIEWGAGSSALGNWSTELGEIFHEVLSQKGINIAGNPKDLFGQERSVQSAEYRIGARITEIKGNICHAHHWWDGRPLNTFSGEMFVSVEWSVFSTLLQREVMQTKTEGYFKQKQQKRDGVMLAFQNAFAHAAENLMGMQDFVDIALRKQKPVDQAIGKPLLNIADKPLDQFDLQDNFDSILPSVVTIRIGTGHGSGFVIAENGLVLTNSHVVGKAKRLSVILNNGLEIEGEVLRVSERRDVALIKIPVRAPAVLPLRTKLPAPLEKVYVVGTPVIEGLKSTVTTGIVSALRQDEPTGLDFIQSDAAISPGNSGGPLLDEGGNVIGISVSSYVIGDSQNLNMFIPIKSALDALNIKKSIAGS